jgi:hypothetical protein
VGSASSTCSRAAGQLIVYRFFLDPGMDIASYPEDGCPGCTMFADNLPNLTHLNARDTTLVFVSAGSQEAIRNYRKRMGWADWPWYTTADDFSADFEVSEWFGINVFLRDGDQTTRAGEVPLAVNPGRQPAPACRADPEPPTARPSQSSPCLSGSPAARSQAESW